MREIYSVEEKPCSLKVQNVVASANFNQTFDLNAIANAFPRDTEFKGRFPGLVFRLKKPKTTILIFNTGKMICSGCQGEEEARRAILSAVQSLKKKGINVPATPEIRITNIVASAILDGTIDLDRLYLSERMRRKIIFEPEQFPALIYPWRNTKVVFLIFSTGKIVCVGAKKESEVSEAVENLRRKLEKSKALIRG